MTTPIQSASPVISIDDIGKRFLDLEFEVSGLIAQALANEKPGRDREKCDAIFGIYTHRYLAPCIGKDLVSRAANFGGETLIPMILAAEKDYKCDYHKGALFHDTAIAYMLNGNEDKFEYLLAMTDEEECKTTGGRHQRGAINLRAGGFPNKSLEERLYFACDLLNGIRVGHAASLRFMIGSVPITPAEFDAWRQKLEPLHQFELLRIIHDLEVFVGMKASDYPSVDDNPFVMLRLAKTLSHLAQWVESCLTTWQGTTGPKGALSGKLTADADFGGPLCAAAGNQEIFAGKNPHGAAVDAELNQLLIDLAAAPAGAARQWRILRILYIVRNSTAHVIEPNLAMYYDRTLLLQLIQVVFISVFVICQLKRKPMP